MTSEASWKKPRVMSEEEKDEYLQLSPRSRAEVDENIRTDNIRHLVWKTANDKLEKFESDLEILGQKVMDELDAWEERDSNKRSGKP